MKIENEDLEVLSQNPLELFYHGIKSKETKNKYTRTLRKILNDILENVLQGSFEDRAAQLVNKTKKDSDWGMSVMLALSKKLKQRSELPKNDPNYLNPTTIPNYFKPIRKLFEMNNVPLVWRRVIATFPELDNNEKGRAYTSEEISSMLKFGNGAIDRAIMLVAASSGIRVGGFNLSWGDIRPVYKIGDKLTFEITESEQAAATIACAIITIYKNTPDEYPGFITPEAYESIQDYKKEWIQQIGKEPKPEEPLFKKDGAFVRILPPNAIRARIDDVLKRAGMRTPLVKGKRRHEVPAMNGFRRFFNKANKETLSKDSPLAALIKKEFMMNHTGLIKLDRNYYQAHIFELIEEYLNAVPNLTISTEEKAKAENLVLRNKNTELEAKNRMIMQLQIDQEAIKEELAKVKKRQEISERCEIKSKPTTKL
ncbi:integrase [Candidatus Nitrosotenuis cloacae]|uniref:integrase n=1 Tax=Candidatus Nitrosotenuis cloacae TaxID=1603555 RepID=UPI002281489C|nr:integrase [Candidatus Nitrosotenuis cloacae]